MVAPNIDGDNKRRRLSRFTLTFQWCPRYLRHELMTHFSDKPDAERCRQNGRAARPRDIVIIRIDSALIRHIRRKTPMRCRDISPRRLAIYMP